MSDPFQPFGQSLRLAKIRDDRLKRGFAPLLPITTQDIAPDMASDREYVDLKLEAAEARTEVRFVELNGKLDRLLADSAASRETFQRELQKTHLDLIKSRDDARSEYKSTRNTVIITTIATGLAIMALLVSIMTYGDAIFSRGMSVRDVVSAASKELADRASSNKQTP